MNNRQTGSEGERRALEYLQNKDFLFIAANYSTRYGELDLIMEEGKTLVFVEVKKRNSTVRGEPEEAVTAIKRNHLAKAALIFIKAHKIFERPVRFDVVSINGEKIRHIPDAFFIEDFYYY